MARTPKTYPELDAVRDLMGTMPDAEIAEQANTSAAKVGRYRRKHGIKAYEGYKFGIRDGSKAVEEAAAPKAKAKAKVKAKSKSKAKSKAKAEPKPKVRKARSGKRPGRKSKISPFRAQVGKVPDREIAELAGVTPEAVRMFRRRHDIALEVERAPAAAPAAPKVPRRRRSKLDPYQDLLGKVPDAEVAAMAGVTSENVRAFRRRHSIQAEWRTEARAAKAAPVVEAPPVVEAAPVVAAAPVAKAPAAARGAQAYAVIVDGKDDVFIVLADSFVAAANEAASRLGDARILSLEHVGSAL